MKMTNPEPQSGTDGYDSFTLFNPPPIPPREIESFFNFFMRKNNLFAENLSNCSSRRFRDGDEGFFATESKQYREYVIEKGNKLQEKYPLLKVSFLLNVCDKVIDVDTVKIKFYFAHSDSLDPLTRIDEYRYLGDNHMSFEQFETEMEERLLEWRICEYIGTGFTALQQTPERSICEVIQSVVNIDLGDFGTNSSFDTINVSANEVTEAKPRNSKTKIQIYCPYNGCRKSLTTSHAERIPKLDDERFNYMTFWHGRELESLRSFFRNHIGHHHKQCSHLAIFRFCHLTTRGRKRKDRTMTDAAENENVTTNAKSSSLPADCWRWLTDIWPFWFVIVKYNHRFWRKAIKQMIHLFQMALSCKTIRGTSIIS